MSNEQQFVEDAVLLDVARDLEDNVGFGSDDGGLDAARDADVKEGFDLISPTSCLQHIGKLFLNNLLDKEIGDMVDTDIAWAIDIPDKRVIGTSHVLFLENIVESVMEDEDLIFKLLGDCEVGVNIFHQIYTHYQAENNDDADDVHRLLKYVTNALVTLGEIIDVRWGTKAPRVGKSKYGVYIHIICV